MTRLLSNLQLGARIGGGAFGEVHEAIDDVHGKIAVKVMQQYPGESAPQWQVRKDALLKEGQHLKQATHQNVVPVFYLVESDPPGSILLAMQYCNGGSLQTAFDKGPMRLPELLKVTTEVCFGLQALHAREMLHRDIKPGNILRRDGIGMLGDFGLVTDDLILGYGSQAGYADHIAPEVWNGNGTSKKTDIWALGMTVYRLLHGAEWYSRIPSPRNLVQAGGFANRLPWLPHVPQRWRRLVRKMMRDDPNERYENVSQVLSALAGCPGTPDLVCRVNPSAVKWTKREAKRRLVVEWTVHSPRQHEWVAWTEPVGGSTGRKRTLGDSGGLVGYGQTTRGLETFFTSKFGP